jgi:hypothetical protein
LFKSANVRGRMREGNGGGGRLVATWRKGNETERALGMAVGSAGQRTRLGTAPGHRAWATARLRNRGERWGVGDAALHDRHAGPGGIRAQWHRPGYVRERRVGQCSDWALTGEPGPHRAGAQFKLSFKPIQKIFKQFK